MLGRSGKPSLRQGLDRDIYQVVRQFEDQREREREASTSTNSGHARISVSAVYDYIQKSNSSLKRQKKRPLEDSIERVLDLRREEAKADGAPDSDEELEMAAAVSVPAKSPGGNARSRNGNGDRDASLLNRQLTKHWNFASAPRGSAVEPDSGATTASVAVERQPNGEAKSKRRRKERERDKGVDRSPPTDLSLHDIAGVGPVIERLIDPVVIPLLRGSKLASLGYRANDGVLLHGPSGCGKTALANAFAANLGVAFIPVSAPSLVSGTSGESEKNIRDVFDEAIRIAPCLIFIDEIDSIAGKRDGAQKAMEGRIVAEISLGMDRIARAPEPGRNVVVLAATNRPDGIDPTIRRRFGVEVDIGMPNEAAREQILRSMTRECTLADDVDFAALARLTPGYVGADLKHVVSAAVSKAMRELLETQSERLLKRSPHVLADITEPEIRLVACAKKLADEEDAARKLKERAINGDTRGGAEIEGGGGGAGDEEEARMTLAHFQSAIATVQPAAKREGFSAIPDTTWASVGALGDVRRRLEMTIIGPIRHPARFARVGIKAAAGILLWGPPGCGKTLVAKAVANESKANFISIKGPELLNKYVGESERAVRQLFGRARSSAPCVLFFDEMDALAPRRDDSLSDASSRVVNALLTEMDGVGDRSGVYVVGATNRPDCIDPAIRRPGRLGTSIFVGLPTAAERVDILRTIYRDTIRSPDGERADIRPEISARLEAIALDRRCTGFSGADLGNLMQAAAQASLERSFSLADDTGGAHDEIMPEDWEKALNEVKPSVKDEKGLYDPSRFDKL